MDQGTSLQSEQIATAPNKQRFSFYPLTQMFNRNNLIIGAIIVAAIILSFIIGTSAVNAPAASAQPQYPEKAKMLGQWIDEQSVIYGTKSKAAEAARIAYQKAVDEQNAARDTAAGYRKSLCVEFKLVRDSGKFAPAQDCLSF